MSDFLSIVASLIGIIIPLMELFLKKDSGTGDNESSVSITINNFSKGSIQNTKRHNTEQDTINHIIDLIIEDRTAFKNYVPIVFTISIIFAIIVFTMQYIDPKLFFVAEYVDGILKDGTKNEEIAYLVAFTSIFTGFFSVSYFVLWYAHEIKLSSILNNFGYLDKPSSLITIQKLLSKNDEFNHFDIYPVKTIGRLISNAKIRNQNKKRLPKNHESEKSFLFQEIIFMPFVFILIIYLVFHFFLSDTAINKQLQHLSPPIIIPSH